MVCVTKVHASGLSRYGLFLKEAYDAYRDVYKYTNYNIFYSDYHGSTQVHHKQHRQIAKIVQTHAKTMGTEPQDRQHGGLKLHARTAITVWVILSNKQQIR